MSWQKYGFGDMVYYAPTSSKAIWKYSDSVTLSELNDDDREIDTTENPKFLKEFVESEDLLESLPSGTYRLECENKYSRFKVIPWKICSELKLFKIGAVEKVIDDFESFKKQKDCYDKVGVVYKRGVLLYGPPGTGKTSAINMIIESIKTEEILLFYVNSSLPLDFITELKKEDRLKIFVFEELTETIEQDKNAFLVFLDGEHSINNSYMIATTNYPHRLPENVVDRPGRFDKLFRVEDIKDSDRRLYLEHFLRDNVVTDKELKITKKYSLAFLKELVLIVLKEGISIEEASVFLDDHKKIVRGNFKRSNSDMGFNNDNDDDDDSN